MRGRILAFAIASLTGCCPPINPTPEIVQGWLSRDLPPESSREEVNHFCQSHEFAYTEKGPLSAEAVRRVGGCDSTKPVVIIDFQYDHDNRLKTSTVHGYQILP